MEYLLRAEAGIYVDQECFQNNFDILKYEKIGLGIWYDGK